MKKLPLILILFSVSARVFSQQKDNQQFWHLTIVDSANHKGIEQPTIVINKTKTFVANDSGIIDINKSFIASADSIIFSSIGYKSVTIIPGVNYNFPSIIKLSPLSIALKEVKLNSGKTSSIAVGNIKKSCNKYWPLLNNYQFVEYIPNEKKITATITNVQIMLNKVGNGINKPLKVGLYAKNVGNIFPGKLLLIDSIMVYNLRKTHILNLDVSKYNINLPGDGVFIVIETFADSNAEVNFWPPLVLAIERLDPYEPFDPTYDPPKDSDYSLYESDNSWTLLKGGNFGMGLLVRPY